MKFTFAPESKPLEGYTIKRAIQRGAFGEVYYALSDAGKEVALKLLQENLDIELRGVSQCLNLKHPNLVTIFDIKTDGDGDHWIVMEYVSGRSFDEVLAEHPQGMPLEVVKQRLSEIAAGIDYLHSRGIVHRDLKPANIYCENDSVKIGDVGLSKFISASRRSAHTQSVGTVYYMAPEIAHGRYGREVDVYSLGVILYEMITGRVPFDGETAGEILMKHLSEQPDLSPIPRPLRPVLANALHKDPNQRTSSVAELERQFRAALEGERVTPPRTNSQPTAPNPQSDRARVLHSTVGHGVPVQTASHASRMTSHRHDWSTFWRIAVVVGLAFLLFATEAVLTLATIAIVLAMIGGGAYGAYWVYREWSARSTDAPPRHRRRRWHAPVRLNRARRLNAHTPRTISLRRRLTELTGSMTSAVICTAILTLGLVLLTSFPTTDEGIGLFVVVAVGASWTLLLLAKIWEGTRVDKSTRRLVLLAAGCLVGAGAWFADGALLAGVQQERSFGPGALYTSVGSHALLDRYDQPTLAAYMIFFGALFALRQWWRLGDGFRYKRLSVGSVLLTMGLAFVIDSVWAFPQDWGLLWAAVIASVVQLSSAWVPHEERSASLASS